MVKSRESAQLFLKKMRLNYFHQCVTLRLSTDVEFCELLENQSLSKLLRHRVKTLKFRYLQTVLHFRHLKYLKAHESVSQK